MAQFRINSSLDLYEILSFTNGWPEVRDNCDCGASNIDIVKLNVNLCDYQELQNRKVETRCLTAKEYADSIK